MEVAVTRRTMHGFFRDEVQGSRPSTRDSECFRIPGQGHSSSAQRRQSAGRQSIMCPPLKEEGRRRRKTHLVLPRLLNIELLLVRLSFCTLILRTFAYAVKPEGGTKSGKLDTQAENPKRGPSLTGNQKLNNAPSTPSLMERGGPILIEESQTDELTAQTRALAAHANPWEGLLDKFDIPRVHGSGVKVDLGNSKKYGSKMYREPGGFCPVYGKFIQLFQPTGNRDIWPNDYLVDVPFAGTPRDTKPLGGGFGLPIRSLSPITLAQLKVQVYTADHLVKPDPYMMHYRRQIKDKLGYCIWWTRISFARDQANPHLDLDLRYRYAIVWDEKKEMCTLLYVNMQEMGGAGTYCTKGDGKPVLTWYCFMPVKTVGMKDRVWASPYTRMDHKTACPQNGLKHVHWGQWNGVECQKMAPRKRVAVKDGAHCATALFDNSPSDNPTKYAGDEGRGWGQIFVNVTGVLLPAGATGNDQPHSRGVGVNWANYYPRSNGGKPRSANECEMYDGVPDCLTVAYGGFAFVSVASPDPEDATLPPCASALEGAFIGGPCKCPPNKRTGWRCTNGKWGEGEEDCACHKKESTGISAWLIAGPVLLGAGLFALLGAYFITKRRRSRPPVHRGNIEDETREHQVQQRKTQTDMLQEAEPSFWREAKEDDPTVVLYGDRMDQEF